MIILQRKIWEIRNKQKQKRNQFTVWLFRHRFFLENNYPYLSLYELQHKSNFFLDLTVDNLMLNFSVFSQKTFYFPTLTFCPPTTSIIIMRQNNESWEVSFLWHKRYAWEGKDEDTLISSFKLGMKELKHWWAECIMKKTTHTYLTPKLSYFNKNIFK